MVCSLQVLHARQGGWHLPFSDHAPFGILNHKDTLLTMHVEAYVVSFHIIGLPFLSLGALFQMTP